MDSKKLTYSIAQSFVKMWMIEFELGRGASSLNLAIVLRETARASQRAPVICSGSHKNATHAAGAESEWQRKLHPFYNASVVRPSVTAISVPKGLRRRYRERREGKFKGMGSFLPGNKTEMTNLTCGSCQGALKSYDFHLRFLTTQKSAIRELKVSPCSC